MTPERTRPWDAGQSVADWQSFLRRTGHLASAVANGLHDEATEIASLAWEAMGGHAPDLGPAPRPYSASRYPSALPVEPVVESSPLSPPRASAPPAEVDYPVAIWVPASRRLWKPRATAPNIVVLHSTENECRPGVARNVARWFCSAPQDCKGVAHYVQGPDELYQCVREADEAGAAGKTANRLGVHIELVGIAASTDWSHGPGLEVITRAARLVADICRRRGIIVQALDAEALRQGQSGITCHNDCTVAWGESCHRDPGLANDQRWPWALFLSLVTAA